MKRCKIFNSWLILTVCLFLPLALETVHAQEDGKNTYTYTTVRLHNAVDLGLSVLWADCNVGGNYPTAYGGLYGWADASGKKTSENNNNYPSANPPSSICGNAAYDIARSKWGGAWKLPSEENIKELVTKCKWKYTTINNREGYIVTGPNGNHIFLPIAGWRVGEGKVRTILSLYWSGTHYVCHGNKKASYCLMINDSQHMKYVKERYWGQSVRPVMSRVSITAGLKKGKHTLDYKPNNAVDSPYDDEVSSDGADEDIDIAKIFEELDRDKKGKAEREKAENEREVPYPIPSDSVPDRTVSHYNGPYAIDLGLSVRWADRNYGAESVSDYGKLVPWGDPYGIKLGDGKYLGANVPNEISGTEKDIVREHWEGKWCIPTCDEMKELVEKCKWEWTTQNGVNGYRVTGPNGNSIFLPAAGCKFSYSSFYKENVSGYYWTSTLKKKNKVWILMFTGKFYDMSSWGYDIGHSIRPVWK